MNKDFLNFLVMVSFKMPTSRKTIWQDLTWQTRYLEASVQFELQITVKLFMLTVSTRLRA